METSPADEAATVERARARIPQEDAEETIRAGRRLLQDPKVRARVDEILAEIRRGGPHEPGITAEELPGFLREHGL